MIRRRIPVRIWIWILIFLTRYHSQLIRINFRYVKYYMVSEETTFQYHPWCLSTAAQRSGRQHQELPRVPWRNVTQLDYGPRYPWTRANLGNIATLYYSGYIVACLLIGVFLEVLNPYAIILLSIILGAFLNVLRVAMAHIHWKALAALEFVVGLNIGMSFPALILWMTRWSPTHERGLFIVAFIGAELAELVMSLNVTYLLPQVGWQAIFYYSSSQVIILWPLFRYLGSGTPDSHPFISEEELEYIKESHMDEVSRTKSMPPYARILRSLAFWSLGALNLGFACCRMLHFIIVPEYLYEYVGKPYSKHPYMQYLPFISFKVVAIIASLTAEKARSKGLMNNTKMVKVYVFFSHFIPGCVLPFITLAGCDITKVFSIISLSLAFLGFAYLSSHRTLVDVTPNFSGAIHGLFEVPAAGLAILANKMNHKFWTTNQHTTVIWPVIFSVVSAALLLPSFLFWTFGTTKCQAWNKKPQDIATIDAGPSKSQDRFKKRFVVSSETTISLASMSRSRGHFSKRSSNTSATSERSDYFKTLW